MRPDLGGCGWPGVDEWAVLYSDYLRKPLRDSHRMWSVAAHRPPDPPAALATVCANVRDPFVRQLPTTARERRELDSATKPCTKLAHNAVVGTDARNK